MTFVLIASAILLSSAVVSLTIDRIAPARTMADEGDMWAEEA